MSELSYEQQLLKSTVEHARKFGFAVGVLESVLWRLTSQDFDREETVAVVEGALRTLDNKGMSDENTGSL